MRFRCWGWDLFFALLVFLATAIALLYAAGCGPKNGIGDDGRPDYFVVPAPYSYPRTWASSSGSPMPPGMVFSFRVINSSSYAVDIGWNQQAGGNVIVNPGGEVRFTTTYVPDVCFCHGMIYEAGRAPAYFWAPRTYRAGVGYLANASDCDCAFLNVP